MKEIQILVLSSHEEILKTVLRLIHSQPGWEAKGVHSSEEALNLCKQNLFDLILIGSGISDQETWDFKKEVSKINPSLPIIQHYGGGSGLLFGEISQALNLDPA